MGDYATAGVAVLITVTDGVCQQAGIGLTNAGPTPVKAGTAESSWWVRAWMMRPFAKPLSWRHRKLSRPRTYEV